MLQNVIYILIPLKAKEAFVKIVEDLKEEDHFNIVLFASSVSTWKKTLVQATPENVDEAKTFIGNIMDGGCEYYVRLMKWDF